MSQNVSNLWRTLLYANIKWHCLFQKYISTQCKLLYIPFNEQREIFHLLCYPKGYVAVLYRKRTVVQSKSLGTVPVTGPPVFPLLVLQRLMLSDKVQQIYPGSNAENHLFLWNKVIAFICNQIFFVYINFNELSGVLHYIDSVLYCVLSYTWLNIPNRFWSSKEDFYCKINVF